MKLNLSENIRTLRKERKLTQEQLAEVLGVTTGAVYKWEAGLSQPELDLIVEMADFFDTSVDVLLGYEMKDNRLAPMIERLNEYCLRLDPDSLSEAEKILGKFPNSFRAVYACALIYLAFGARDRDPAKLRRALDLFSQSIALLPQNSDPRINEAIISSNMAMGRFLLDEGAEGLEILKENNAGGMFSHEIGLFLACFLGRPEEASLFLSEGLMRCLAGVLDAIFGYVCLFRSRNDWDSALAAIHWGFEILSGLKTEDQPDFLYKVRTEFLAMQAFVQSGMGEAEASAESLRKAAEAAKRFDSTPDYSLKTMRFADKMDQVVIFDLFSTSADESVLRLLDLMQDEPLKAQWKELMEHE